MARDTKPPEGVPADDEPKPPGMPNDEPPADALPVAELREQVAGRGVDVTDVEGSGKDGRVVKADLVDVVNEVPEPPAGRPPLIDVAQSAAAVLTPTED